MVVVGVVAMLSVALWMPMQKMTANLSGSPGTLSFTASKTQPLKDGKWKRTWRIRAGGDMVWQAVGMPQLLPISRMSREHPGWPNFAMNVDLALADIGGGKVRITQSINGHSASVDAVAKIEDLIREAGPDIAKGGRGARLANLSIAPLVITWLDDESALPPGVLGIGDPVPRPAANLYLHVVQTAPSPTRTALTRQVFPNVASEHLPENGLLGRLDARRESDGTITYTAHYHLLSIQLGKYSGPLVLDRPVFCDTLTDHRAAYAVLTTNPKPDEAQFPPIERWRYFAKHLTPERIAALENPPADERQPWRDGVSISYEKGALVLTGPLSVVRHAATILRVIDQPKVKSPLDLPLRNMPPEFFIRTALPVLTFSIDLAKAPLTDGLREVLQKEGITHTQLARALAGHVIELEKAVIKNNGPTLESIKNTPGASTFYDATIPCLDLYDGSGFPTKQLTFRIERTVQQMGTISKFASLPPWLLEEAKKQSKEPLSAPGKDDVKVEAAKPPSTPAPDAKPEAKAPSQPASDVRLSVEEKTSYTEGTERGENRTISIQADKPGYVHIWTPGGKRFTEALYGNSQVAHIGFHSTTGFSSRVSYSLYQSEGPVLAYWIRNEIRHLVELAKQNLTYADVAKSLHEVRDPTGVCLRNTTYDLAPIGDSALLLAVTDTAEPPPETSFFLHIWQPPLQREPARLFECIAVRIGEVLITPGEPGKNAGNKLTGQRVGKISQRDGKYHASLQYSAGSTAMLNEPMTPEMPIAVSMHLISAGSMWPQFMLLSTKKDMTPFLKEEFFKPATAEEIQRGTSLVQQAAQLAATKGKAWKSEVLDLRRANGAQYKSILILEFAPFAGFRDNPPDASVKVSGASPAEGPFKVSVGIADPDFKDVRLEEKDGVRTIKITQAIESVDKPTKKTERILNDYRSMSFNYLLTADTLTLKGFPTDEITWGSMGFIAPTRDIVFKLEP